MASIRSSKKKLFIDFRYRGQRCREFTGLADTPAHRRRLLGVIKRMEAEITLGSFDYGAYFPNSSRVDEFRKLDERAQSMRSKVPLLSVFAEDWMAEKKVEWRQSYYDTVAISLRKYILPRFGAVAMDMITKAEVLKFRADIASDDPSGERRTLSPSRVNHIMTPLRMMLTEGADRYGFQNPYQNIKPLKEPRTSVQPFNLQEVQLILKTVRKDFKNYFTVRFFTGLRTGEIDGLIWKNVDFERRQILVHQAIVQGKIVPTKTDGSFRAVDMSQMVFEALQDQYKVTSTLSDYVFCTGNGQPLNNRNVTRRVWHPLLRYLNLEKRRPYQTRHTAATLWLAAGESPEWIARQMGHSSTEMLFKVYSRYVPNLTRQDGSAFEALLNQAFRAVPEDELPPAEMGAGQVADADLDTSTDRPVPGGNQPGAGSQMPLAGQPVAGTMSLAEPNGNDLTERRQLGRAAPSGSLPSAEIDSGRPLLQTMIDQHLQTSNPQPQQPTSSPPLTSDN